MKVFFQMKFFLENKFNLIDHPLGYCCDGSFLINE